MIGVQHFSLTIENVCLYDCFQEWFFCGFSYFFQKQQELKKLITLSEYNLYSISNLFYATYA